MPITRNSLLIRLRRNADPTSWHEFASVYEPFLLRAVRNCGVPEQDVGDIVQEVFLRLLRVLPRFEYQPARGRFRAWLRVVTHSVVNDWRRKRGRRRELVVEQLDAWPAATKTDEDAWDDGHRCRVFHHALAAVRSQVSSQSWICFEEYVLNDRRAADVAAELALNTNAVYVIASRVRRRLRRKCTQFDEDLEHDIDALSC